ncbi:MAG: hypothetical protein ACKOA7_02270, partial [Bacteroidota bacterium]
MRVITSGGFNKVVSAGWIQRGALNKVVSANEGTGAKLPPISLIVIMLILTLHKKVEHENNGGDQQGTEVTNQGF